jgi:hypothetical protein
MGKSVRDTKKGAHQIETQGTDAQISPSVCNDVGFKGQERTVFLQACFEINDRGVSLAVSEKNFLLTDDHLDRFPRFPREKSGTKIHIEHFVLTPKATPDIRLNHTDVAERDVQGFGQISVSKIRTLF